MKPCFLHSYAQLGYGQVQGGQESFSSKFVFPLAFCLPAFQTAYAICLGLGGWKQET